MATYTVIISDESNKTKHLLNLIKELAKTEKDYITIEHTPNSETVQAMEDSKKGNVEKTTGKKDFFDKLNS